MPVIHCYQVQVPFESAMSIGENSEATKYYKGDISQLNKSTTS